MAAGVACDALAWHEETHECYLKTNPAACPAVVADTLCPWNAGRGAVWQYHMHCPCSTEGVFKVISEC